MVAGHEWTRFTTKRQTLWGSSLRGAQQSPHWLRLPYQYSVELLEASTLFAWLASQDVFVVKTNNLEGTRAVRPEKSILRSGYFPEATVLAIIFETYVLRAAKLIGVRRYPLGMPLAATCVATISAACHGPDDDPDDADFHSCCRHKRRYS